MNAKIKEIQYMFQRKQCLLLNRSYETKFLVMYATTTTIQRFKKKKIITL